MNLEGSDQLVVSVIRDQTRKFVPYNAAVASLTQRQGAEVKIARPWTGSGCGLAIIMLNGIL